MLFKRSEPDSVIGVVDKSFGKFAIFFTFFEDKTVL